MRFWILTLLLAMVAGTAQADSASDVSVNNDHNRKIRIYEIASDEAELQPLIAQGNINMEFEVIAGFDPGHPVFPEEGATTGFAFHANLFCNGTVPYLGEDRGDLGLQSNLTYGFWLTVGGVRKQLFLFNPHCSRWGTNFGTYSTRGYLMDNQEDDEIFWTEKVRTQELIIDVQVINIETGELGFHPFHGVIPSNQ